MSITNFPILYAKSNTNKTRIFKIWVEHFTDYSIIYTECGQENGIMTKTEKKITTGKNLNKKNATTFSEQAIKEARSKFNKQKDKHYFENIEHINSNDKIMPMLAQDYTKYSHKLTFPLYCQPKLDGIRAIYRNNKIFSRQNKEFLSVKHIIEELQNCSYILDGELYNDNIDFSNLVSAVKTQELNKNIYYYVFDLIDEHLTFEERYNKLKNYINTNNFIYIKLVPIELIEKKEDINDYHEKFISQNYEGIILRNKLGKYKLNYRSSDLQKYKLFEDKEFKIVGYSEGTGIDKGTVIWKAITENQKCFYAKPIGTLSHRKKLFEYADLYINKYIKIKFQGYSNDGIPRFPVALEIRDYE